MELREGNKSEGAILAQGVAGSFTEMTMEMLIDFVAINTDGVLMYYNGVLGENVMGTITGPRKGIIAGILSNNKEYIKIDGDSDIIEKLMMFYEQGNKHFNIIEP